MSRRRRVLIVDEEKNIRTTLARALESLGVEIETAGSPAKGLEMLQGSSFDLVLLDIRPPEIDGIELLRRTRALRPETRVVVITAHGTVDAAVSAMKLGVLDFIQKPFSPDEIREVVAAALESATADADEGVDYEERTAEARRRIEARELDSAILHLRKAVGAAPDRPEAFSLLGVAAALDGNLYRAQDFFRASIALDPTYGPARKNLEHCGIDPSTHGWDLGDERK